MDLQTQRLMMAAAGAVGGATYVDDVFSTYVYEGDGTTSHQIVNGIDLATHGGLIWGKERGNSGSHYQFDTERGLNKRLKSNSNSAEETDTFYSSVNSNGYTINKTTSVNVDGNDYASWTFRKAPGFFDIVTYTGNGTAGRQLSHNLGCAPGMVAIKCTSDSHNWSVWHRGLSSNAKTITLNDSAAEFTNDAFNGAAPSSTVIHLSSTNASNANTKTYVAYLWAGGESTAATARSVDFDGSGDYLTVAGPGALGTSTDFTMECWVYLDDDASGTHHRIFSANEGSNSDEATQIRITGGEWQVYIGRNTSSDYWNWTGGTADVGQWYHLALVRHGTNNAFYVNGVLQSSATGSHNVTITTLVIAGGYGTENINGKVSNARFVNGTAVYTSSFKPPTEPLTSITNTTLLCCNNSSTTGKTTGGTITANGDPTASIDSPFDDSSCFVFGENEDQDVIKCGSYTGNGSSTGPTINLGWEPQWIMAKRTDGAGDWDILDSMRGWTTNAGNTDGVLMADLNDQEYEMNRSYLTPTGFGIETTSGGWNASGGNYIFVALRRPDGYVGKPPELGTDVFNMGLGQNSTTIPNYISGFPVDIGIHRLPASTSFPVFVARLMASKYLRPDTADAEASGNWATFDSNTGYITNQQDNTHQAWMWKRSAGFDVVTYTGNGTSGHSINHSLGTKSPEMIWIKRRDTSGNAGDWMVGHKGLNGGSSPWNEYLVLNKTQEEYSDNNPFNNVAPTTTSFQLSNWDRVNANNSTYISMLFASVDGISKVGYYTGDATSNRVLTFGFQPRFLLLKIASNSSDWNVWDSVRGFDKRLKLNDNGAQDTNQDFTVTSTGVTISDATNANANGYKYIYYAHA